MSILQNFRKVTFLRNHQWQFLQKFYSTKPAFLEYEKDPQPAFTDPETQRLLVSITRLHLNKVFRKTAVSDNRVEYKFMTTEELETEFRKTVEKARQRLQMPPVVQIKKDEHKILSEDKDISQFSDSKFVFTDITYGLPQSKRKVVVRQIDGTLEYAPMDVTKRMRQLYFPQVGQELIQPPMFDDEHLIRCLDEHKYEFVLDRMLIQFEPYEADFHRISSKVYQHLNETKEFDLLRSTRHFGPMAFFYAWHKCIDELLYDMIQRDYLKNAAELIILTYKIHNIKVDYKPILQKLEQTKTIEEEALFELRKSIKNQSNDIRDEIQNAIGKTNEDFEIDDICLQFIEQYISNHALKKVQLELAVQTLKEINAEKKHLYKGLSKAHGI